MHNPFVPETLEGWSLLHLMYRVRWDRLRSTDESARQQMAEEAVNALAVPDAGSTAFVQLLGHKGDLMVICFRRGFEELAHAQLAFSRTALHDHLEPTTSYVSVVELGMYEMTAKIHEQLGANHKPGSEEF
jgi:chlorite dismutase